MSENSKNLKGKKKSRIIIGIVILLLILIVSVLIFMRDDIDKHINKKSILTVETPQKISVSQEEEIVLDVTISSLGDAIYPAASMSISFDAACLEFVGVEEGNVFISNIGGKVAKKLPEWSCNPDACNESGVINIMYLDTTGGKNAFSQEYLAEENNVVLRLKFRLRGSANIGDVYDLIVEDAVFAASDETKSIAMTRDTLTVQNGKIVIGE